MGKAREAEILCCLSGTTRLERGRAGTSRSKSFLLKDEALLALAPEFAAQGRLGNHFYHCQYSTSSVTACLREAVGFYGLRSNWKEERLALWAP